MRKGDHLSNQLVIILMLDIYFELYVVRRGADNSASSHCPLLAARVGGKPNGVHRLRRRFTGIARRIRVPFILFSQLSPLFHFDSASTNVSLTFGAVCKKVRHACSRTYPRVLHNGTYIHQLVIHSSGVTALSYLFDTHIIAPRQDKILY